MNLSTISNVDKSDSRMNISNVQEMLDDLPDDVNKETIVKRGTSNKEDLYDNVINEQGTIDQEY